MEFNDFLSFFENPKTAGGGNYMVRCPAHEDSHESLSIKEGETGKIMVKCFAGCTPESIVGALGLELKDLFIDNNDFNIGVRTVPKPKQPKPVKVEDAKKIERTRRAIKGMSIIAIPQEVIIYLVEERGIPENKVHDLIQNYNIRYVKKYDTYTKKDIDWCVFVTSESSYVRRRIDGEKKQKTKNEGEANFYNYDKAIKHNNVFIVEGETEVLTYIVSTGLDNVISVGGVYNAKKLATKLKEDVTNGQTVYILLDDDEAGGKGTGTFVRELKNSTVNHVIGDYNNTDHIDANGEKLKDLNDILTQGGGMEAVAKLIEYNSKKEPEQIVKEATNIDWEKVNTATTVTTEDTATTGNTGDTGEAVTTVKPLTVTKYTVEEVENVKELEYIYRIGEHILPRGIVGMVSSRGGLGKSSFMLHLVTQLVLPDYKTGLLHIDNIEKNIRCLYFSIEDVETVVLNRFKTIMDNYKLSPEQKIKLFDSIDFIYDIERLDCEEDTTTAEGDGKRIKGEKLKQRIIATIEEGKHKLIIIDTLSRFCPLETETDNIKATAFIQELEKVARSTNCTILLVHHTNKDSVTSGAIIGSSRGSSALVDGVRYSLTLKDLYIEQSGKGNRASNQKYREVKEKNKLESILELYTAKSNYSKGFKTNLVITDVQKMEEVTDHFVSTVDDMMEIAKYGRGGKVVQKGGTPAKIDNNIRYKHERQTATGRTPKEFEQIETGGSSVIDEMNKLKEGGKKNKWGYQKRGKN